MDVLVKGKEKRLVRKRKDGCRRGETELAVASLQGLNTLKASEFTWRTRIQKGNNVNTSSSKTHDSSTSPTRTR